MCCRHLLSPAACKSGWHGKVSCGEVWTRQPSDDCVATVPIKRPSLVWEMFSTHFASRARHRPSQWTLRTSIRLQSLPIHTCSAPQASVALIQQQPTTAKSHSYNSYRKEPLCACWCCPAAAPEVSLDRMDTRPIVRHDCCPGGLPEMARFLCRHAAM